MRSGVDGGGLVDSVVSSFVDSVSRSFPFKMDVLYHSTAVLVFRSQIHSHIVTDDQQDANFGLFICVLDDVHVLGDVFAHHQEHLTVFTASDIVHLCCCRPV